MRRGTRRSGWSIAALAASVALVSTGCGAPGATSAGPPAPPATDVPLAPTPWPNGTVGRYGLRVDPALLARLPATVSGEPLVESPLDELPSLDDADLATSSEAFAVARVGMVGDPNWVVSSIVRLKPEAATEAFYGQLAADYEDAACSQADGVAGVAHETIGDRDVTVATCKGGPNAYAVRLENDVVVLATDLGPRRLGRQLLAALP